MIYGNNQIKEKEPEYTEPTISENDIQRIKESLPDWFKVKYCLELEDNKKIMDEEYWICTKDVLRILNGI